MSGVGIDMGDIDAGRGEIGVQTAAEVIAARLAAEGRLRAGAGGSHASVQRRAPGCRGSATPVWRGRWHGLP